MIGAPRRRSAMQAFLGGYLYLLGGENGTKPTGQLFRVDLPLAALFRPEPSKSRSPRRGARRRQLRPSRRRLDGFPARNRGAEVHAARHDSLGGTASRRDALPGGALLGHTLYVAGGRTRAGPHGEHLCDRYPKTHGRPCQSGQLLRPSNRPSSSPREQPHACSAARLGRTGKPRLAVIRIDPATGNPTAAGIRRCRSWERRPSPRARGPWSSTRRQARSIESRKRGSARERVHVLIRRDMALLLHTHCRFGTGRGVPLRAGRGRYLAELER